LVYKKAKAKYDFHLSKYRQVGAIWFFLFFLIVSLYSTLLPGTFMRVAMDNLLGKGSIQTAFFFIYFSVLTFLFSEVVFLIFLNKSVRKWCDTIYVHGVGTLAAIGFSIWGLIPGYAIYNYGKAGFQAELLQYFLAGVVLNIAFTIFISFHKNLTSSNGSKNRWLKLLFFITLMLACIFLPWIKADFLILK